MVRVAEIGKKAIEPGIDRAIDGVPAAAEMHDARRGDGLFRHRRLHVIREEPIVVEHHRPRVADPPGHPQCVRQGGSLELDLLLRLVDLDPVQSGDEVVVPIGAAKLAVAGRAQPGFLLLADRPLDAAILQGAERVRRQAPGPVRRTRLGQLLRAQQAADVVGAERRPGARLHLLLGCCG